MKKKTLRQLLEIFLIIVLIICSIVLYPYIRDWWNSKQVDNEIKEVVDDTIEEDDVYFTKEAWNELKSQNSDLFAYVVFPNYMETPIMRSVDRDDYYYRRSFNKEYNTQGVPYVEGDTEEYTQNIIMYGHNVYYDDGAAFSPISFLVDQSTFDAHHTFYVYFENEMRTYEVTNSYEYDTYDEEFNFQQSQFYEETPLLEYIKWPNEHNEIVSNYTVDSENDQLVTFQTCKRWSNTRRIIVTGKLISKSEY